MTANDKKSRYNSKQKLSKTSKAVKRSHCCRFCKTYKGVIRKYNLYICRRCFNDHAEELGFRKLD